MLKIPLTTMTTSALWSVITFFMCLVRVSKLLDNGLARTPPMGWMSWGYYECNVDCKANPDNCLNENLIKTVADFFYTEGYLEAGYEYIIIDDCWSEMERDNDGRLVPDRERFPNGMKYLADYIHRRGLKFGMYTNVGRTTCKGYPGSRDHFVLDAQTFAEWEVDYLKVDGCFVEENFLNTAYIELGLHLNATGRPMVYSCSWPYYIEYIIKKTPDYSRVARHCNTWRSYHDVVRSWAAVKNIIRHYVKRYSQLSPHHRPGQWNDPDMLILGTDSLTPGQSRVHLAAHAMLAAPLLLSCDVRNIKQFERKLLLNADLIAVAQDPLGVMAEPFQLQNSIIMWMKQQLPRKGDKYHSVSFALINLTEEDAAISFTPGHYGLNCTDGYTVMDPFTGIFFRNITVIDVISTTVPAEDVIMYTMFPL